MDELCVDSKASFVQRLLNWYHPENRDNPLAFETDPYKIWVGEIIMQQTRLTQGLPYLTKILEHYPSVEKLAMANQNDLLSLWQGLGYYRRAINLLKGAKYIVEEKDGQLPTSYKSWLEVNGVGTYTAAAIASKSNKEPKAAIDGNVIRVLSRVFNLDFPYDKAEEKRMYHKIADELIHLADPALFNQAIMDFGAMQCRPKNPTCASCHMADMCLAYLENKVSSRPVIKLKGKKQKIFLYYFLVRRNGKIFIQKRPSSGIYKDMYELYSIENIVPLSQKEIGDRLKHHWVNNRINFRLLTQKIQILTHRTLHITFYQFDISDKSQNLKWPQGWWKDPKNLVNLPFPNPVRSFIENYPFDEMENKSKK